jgi:hypothetical protein
MRAPVKGYLRPPMLEYITEKKEWMLGCAIIWDYRYVFANDLDIQNCTQELFVSTHGIGIWKSTINLPSSYPIIYDEDITLTSTYNHANDVFIESGVTVTLTGKIEMLGAKNIIIEPGAHLIVDGGTLTNSCEAFWGGVTVLGQKNLPQTSSNQGKITLRNDAVIENAMVGVSLWELDNWSTAGGIIDAEDAFFINNKKDVEFVNYQNIVSGVLKPNVSRFKNVSFEWDDAFLADFPLGHVTMYRVNGIRFSGCDFEDNRTSPESRYFTDYGRTNSGIYSIDAQYYVLPVCNSLSVSGCTGPLDDPDWKPSTFKNLDFGIYASNATSEYNIVIDRTLFENNLYGTQIVNVNEPIITRNKYLVNDESTNNFTISTQYGIHAVRSKGLKIQENDFIRVAATNPVNGIVCSDLGEANEEIYKNHFENLYHGIVTQGKNRSFVPGPSAGNGLRGLEFYCNDNELNQYDHRVLSNLWGGPSSSSYGVRRTNGISTNPSGNKFSTDDVYPGNHYNNETFNPLFYTYYNGDADQNPTDVTGPVSALSSINTNSCLSHLSEGYFEVLSPTEITSLYSSFSSVSTNYNTKFSNYMNLVNNGNSDSLLTVVEGLTTGNSGAIRNDLLSISPYLTENIVREAIDNPTTVFPHAWSYQLIMENIEVAYEYGFIDFLSSKNAPMPSWMIEDIENMVDTLASTDMLVKQFELAALSSEKSTIANTLITHFKNRYNSNRY